MIPSSSHNGNSIEITVSIKDAEQKLTKKDLAHTPFQISHQDPYLQQLVSALQKDFKGDLNDAATTIKVSYQW